MTYYDLFLNTYIWEGIGNSSKHMPLLETRLSTTPSIKRYKKNTSYWCSIWSLNWALQVKDGQPVQTSIPIVQDVEKVLCSLEIWVPCGGVGVTNYGRRWEQVVLEKANGWWKSKEAAFEWLWCKSKLTCLHLEKNWMSHFGPEFNGLGRAITVF
jgi:hypothetical protein